MDQMLEKLHIICKYKGDIWDLKNNKQFYLAQKKISFCVVSVYAEQSPNNGPTKFFFKQNFNIYA
jgi:hypothetical protein